MATYQFKLRDWQAGTVIADISSCLYEPEGVYRPNRPGQWTGSVDLQNALAANLRALSTSLEVIRNGVTRFHGFTWRIQRKGDRNKAAAQVTWVDPMIQFTRRTVRDSLGRFAKPVFAVPITGGALISQAITNSGTWEGSPPPSPMAVLIGSDTTTVDLANRIASYPLKISEMALILGSSGRCDHYISPRTDVAGRLGEIRLFDRLGSDRSASVKLEYGTGLFNAAEAELIEDAEGIANALWFFGGPKYDQQHWRFNITKDDGNLPNPPQATIAAAIAASRALYGYWQDMRFWDDLDDPDPFELQDVDRPMWRRVWQLEQYFRLAPRELLTLTPDAETIKPWDDFFLGDKIGVKADGLGRPVAGKQRIYGFKVMPGNESVETVALAVSPDDAP